LPSGAGEVEQVAACAGCPIDETHGGHFMKRTAVAAICFIGACSATALAQSSCKVTRENFVNHGSAPATMTLQQGESCDLRFRFGGSRAPDSWKLVTPPKSGTVTFKDDVAEFRPAAGFTGEDKFSVEVFGRAPNCSNRCERNGRFDVTVSVLPKS
jgi:hypothetical protein